MRPLKKTFPFLIILSLLASPAVAINLAIYSSRQPHQIGMSLAATLVCFIIPAGLFYRNIQIYLYLLTPLVLFTPLFLFSTYYFLVPPGFELIAFILQTNPREAREAVAPFVFQFILFETLFTGAYLFAVSRVEARAIPARRIMLVSVSAIAILSVVTIIVNDLYLKHPRQISKYDLIPKYEYPFTLISGIMEARGFLRKNHLRSAENFSFKAVKNDSLSTRQVYVLIIGESSRWDRWQINGYQRPTSPRLAARDNLITCKDVVAGAHYTWVSVPQIITRANPDNYDLQYREKSILGVFKEAGFKTYWLSNQSDQDIFWSGSIVLHAKTADVSSFSPTYSPNLEFENIYDGRLLPILDSVLTADHSNLFIVLHTMGNHWEYNRRYPPEFDFFQPSRYQDPDNPTHMINREAISNAYDNSILYADYLIDHVIDLVEHRADIAAVTYISDHGEDLFDAYGDRPDFHFRPSAETLRVPLFFWTSRSYDRHFPDKRWHLESNASDRIGTENIFYTLTDLANIRIDKFDSTKSLAHPSFIDSEQKYYGDDNRAHVFSQLR
jgi:glucan phosphoethanolaminetransferase (alkaline phosphatase superfamily)